MMRKDYDQTPFIAIWEITRACDLACRHCRAEAISRPLAGELNSKEGLALLEEIASMGTPICVLSGGDPAKRQDLSELVRHGTKLGMRMATIPAATPLLTPSLLEQLKDAGLSQLALSLDGPSAEIHDGFRGVAGAFRITLRGAQDARKAGLPLQINTTFSAYNYPHFEAIVSLVQRLGIVFWEVFLLVPVGRGRVLGQLDALECEELFSRLAELSRRVDFIIKVTEAPHYRRWLAEHDPGRLSHLRRPVGPRGSIGLSPVSINSGKGHLFVSYAGDIYPSGFLPLRCGNVRTDSLSEVYRNHPVFVELRSPELLKGKCGHCNFARICGGSRARAYAMTGDYLAEDPLCAYQPQQNPTSAAAEL